MDAPGTSPGHPPGDPSDGEFLAHSMSFEVKTLFLLTVDVEAILGLLLLLVWVQNIRLRAVAWWGSAHLLRCLSVLLYGLYGSVPELISIDLANAILFSSFGVTWNGARVFNGRASLPGSLVAGAAIWLAACQLPGFEPTSEIRGLLSSMVIATYAWLTAYEFWRGRDEPLVSRWPAILLFFTLGAQYLLRTPLSSLLPGNTGDGAFASAWLTILSLDALLMTIATAFILLAMSKERTELRHKTAAMLDPLTGLRNRRAFLQDAQVLMQRQIARDCPVAVFLVDLDHFKSINDHFGHSIGDRVLEIFARTAHANLGPADIVGRLGGEEFAVLLEDAGRDNAFVVADRLRSAFAADAAIVDGHAVNATTSIGVSVIVDPAQDLSRLLAQADRALYRAKARGRDRVEVTAFEFSVADDAPPPIPEAGPQRNAA